MKLSRLIVISMAVLMLAACKVKVVITEGGTVTSESGTYSCEPGKPCNINVVDIFFDETFSANPAKGYEFHAWKTQERGLCGGKSKPCKLSTTGFANFPNLMAALESNEVFYLTPVFVKSSDTLRVFNEGDQIKYKGTISSGAPGGAVDTAEVKAVREFFETENTVNEFKVMLHQLTLRLKSDGSEFPEASYYWQDRGGAWYDLSDTGGNWIIDPRSIGVWRTGLPFPPDQPHRPDVSAGAGAAQRRKEPSCVRYITAPGYGPAKSDGATRGVPGIQGFVNYRPGNSGWQFQGDNDKPGTGTLGGAPYRAGENTVVATDLRRQGG